MSFGMYLLAILLPPVYFLVRGRWIAAILNGTVWSISIILLFVVVGIIPLILCIAHACWDLANEIRKTTITEQAKAIAKETSKVYGK